MKKSLARRLFSPIAILQIIILCVLMLFALGLTTPLGPIAIERISNAFFTPLKIKEFHGSFLTGLKVGSLQWEDPDTTVELEHIIIDKPRYNFEKNQLHSDRVSAQRLVIRLPPSDDTPSEKITSLPDFALPLNIKTDALALQSFEVIQENEVIFQVKDIVLTQPNIEQEKLKARAATAQLIIAGSPLNLNVQQFVMNMNQPHDMHGNGRADFKYPQLGEAKATFELEGTLTAYRFKLKGKIASEQVSPQTIQLEGQGDYDQVVFNQIKTQSIEGNSKSNATVEWTPEIMWQLDTKLEQIKLAKHLPDWPAEFDATLNYQGSYQQNSLDGMLNLASLEGILNGKKIKANAKIKHKDQQLTISTIQATLGQNEIKASGQATPPFDVSWDINAKNLRQVFPDESIDLSGELIAKGTLKGTLEKPVLNATIHAQQLRFQQYALGSADLIATSTEGVYNLKGDLAQLDLAQQKISKANINASGIIEDHQLELSFTHTDAKVQLNAKGGWKAPQWQGSLQRLVLDTKQVSKWQLQQPVNINASKDQLTISKFCLVNRSAHSCSTVHWAATTGVDAEGSLKRTPLALLNPFLPDDMVLKGNVNGRYKIKQQHNKLVGEVSLQLPASSVVVGDSKQKQQINYKSLTLNAVIKGQKITATTKLVLKNKGELSANADILLATNGSDHHIDAKGKFKHIPLAMATPWLPKDIQLKGNAKGAFKLKQRQGKAVGDVSLELLASSVIMGEGRQQQRIAYKSLTLNAIIDGQKITATTRLVLQNKGKLSADADILLATRGTDHRIDAKGKFKRIP
jgi:autotransporter translocation and assembly factor TamB